MKSDDKKKYLPARKVKIIDSSYNEKSDLVRWTLFFYDNGLEQVYVWPSVDLLASLNIKGNATPDMLQKFCSSMKGKDINFVIDEEPKMPDVQITEEQYRKLNKEMSSHFDNFKNEILGE